MDNHCFRSLVLRILYVIGVLREGFVGEDSKAQLWEIHFHPWLCLVEDVFMI